MVHDTRICLIKEGFVCESYEVKRIELWTSSPDAIGSIPTKVYSTGNNFCLI